MEMATLPASSLLELRRLMPGVRFQRIEKAHRLAEKLYGNKILYKSSIPLLEQVFGTLEILSIFSPDEDAVVACLLQHSLTQGYSVRLLEEQFGKAVRTIVSRIHLLSHLNMHDWRKSIDDMKVMLVELSDDLRVLLLKLCIHCFILEHLHRVDPDEQRRLCRESLSLYAPVAARLGIYSIKYRLEDCAFPVTYPVDAERIREQLQAIERQHGDFLSRLVEALKGVFAREKFPVTVVVRQKHPYSIFLKMHRKSMTDIREIGDLIAVRVMVPQLADCYQALGLLHTIATPIGQRFKDYIAFPKPNGYQSLHTSLIGVPGAPADMTVEIQIRTEDMHRCAEYGVAAHWSYKEGGTGRALPHSRILKDVLRRQQTVTDPAASAASSISDMVSVQLADHIYALTPKGDIIELPKGGTPLDFAFAIHTDLGLKFKGARVNGAIVPLDYRLENGDIVEILTHKHPRPTIHWLTELRTPSARSKLKAYFFSHHRSTFFDRGRVMLNEEFREKSIPELDADLSALKTFDDQPQAMRAREDLLVKIGMGSVRASSVLRHLAIERPKLERKIAKPNAQKAQKLIAVEGEAADMPFRFAKCCSVDSLKPRPEDIVGFVTRQGDVAIHKENCGMIRGGNPHRRVQVKWMR